jgi:hypothetical protein
MMQHASASIAIVSGAPRHAPRVRRTKQPGLARPGGASLAVAFGACALAGAIACGRHDAGARASAARVQMPEQRARGPIGAAVASAGFAGKGLHLWTTSCDPRSEEARATGAAVARLGHALRTVGLVCLALREDGAVIDAEARGPGLASELDRGGVRRGALISTLVRAGATTALVLANPREHGFDGAGAAKAISTAASRARVVERLVAAQATEGHAAVELDLESLPTAASGDLVALVSALRAALPPAVELVVDVHAKTVDDPGWPGPGAHDYGALARAGAIVRLMTYDFSLGPVPAGPTTKASWIRAVVAYARGAGVPAAQLEIGLPAYGYDFPPVATRDAAPADEPPRPLRWREAIELRARVGATLLRDDAGAPHFVYRAAEGAREVWFDDGESVGRLLDELRDVAGEVRGVALWGVYGADPGVLDAWLRAFEGAPAGSPAPANVAPGEILR